MIGAAGGGRIVSVEGQDRYGSAACAKVPLFRPDSSRLFDSKENFRKSGRIAGEGKHDDRAVFVGDTCRWSK
jgi:hypothetical protein